METGLGWTDYFSLSYTAQTYQESINPRLKLRGREEDRTKWREEDGRRQVRIVVVVVGYVVTWQRQ